VVLVGTLIIAAWIAVGHAQYGLVGACAFLMGLVILRDVKRFKQLRRLRELAALGSLTEARVTHTRMVANPPTERADSVFLGSLVPLRSLLLICYTFTDEQGTGHRGSFTARRGDRAYYPTGRILEIFYFPDQPTIHACSLVLRWYFRFRGPAATDESPPVGFPDQEDIRLDMN
jgi:hypothetical protein